MKLNLTANRFATSSRHSFLLMVIGLIGIGLSFAADIAIAQGAEMEETEEAEVVEEQPAEQPGAGVGETTDADADPDAPKGDRTYLEWTFEALGWSYSIVFLAMSFTLVALFVMNLLQARRENVLPTDLIQSFEAHLDAKEYQEAYELARNDDSFLGKVLSAGLGKISSGYEHAIEAMQEVGEDESMKIEHRLSYMALIGTISPMVGLLGTVQGMIASFNVIASSVQTPPAYKLAEGISTALFTTLVGLLIAIPAIAAYNILRNRASRLTLEVGIVSEGLMNRFQSTGAKKQA